jgi:hypothetical protein
MSGRKEKNFPDYVQDVSLHTGIENISRKINIIGV